jgi:hypothetical protein
MKKLHEILTDLEQGKISSDHAEQQVLNLFAVMWQSEQLFCKCKTPSDRSDSEIDRSCFNCGKPIAK